VTLVPVETIIPGDRIVLPRGGRRRVSRVARYPDAPELGSPCSFVVIYEDTSEAGWENRAGAARGAELRARTVLKGLRTLRAGDLVEVTNR
jgi:hypothetical protein